MRLSHAQFYFSLVFKNQESLKTELAFQKLWPKTVHCIISPGLSCIEQMVFEFAFQFWISTMRDAEAISRPHSQWEGWHKYSSHCEAYTGMRYAWQFSWSAVMCINLKFQAPASASQRLFWLATQSFKIRTDVVLLMLQAVMAKALMAPERQLNRQSSSKAASLQRPKIAYEIIQGQLVS